MEGVRRAVLRLLPVLLFTSCGGNNNLSTTPVSGAYEFVITSNVTGGVTLVEANFTANGSQSGATGPNQVQVLTHENKIYYVNGVCFGSTPGKNSVSTIRDGNSVTVTFDDGGNSFSAQGAVTGTTISGNYSITDSKCPDLMNNVGVPQGSDSGGFTGNEVPLLQGTFSGTLNLPTGLDNAILTLTEDKNYGLNVNLKLSGVVDNGSFSLSGSAIGNVAFVSGTVSGQSLSLFAYYDRLGSLTGTANSLLVFDYGTLANVGLLLKS